MVGVVRDGFGIPMWRGVFLKYINILNFVLVHQVCRFNVQSPVGWSFWGHFLMLLLKIFLLHALTFIVPTVSPNY